MILFGAVAAVALTFALMLLWNWLMPLIFGLTVITFWQAMGLLALSKILLGRGYKHHGHKKGESNHHHKDKFMKRFAKRRNHEDVEQE